MPSSRTFVAPLFGIGCPFAVTWFVALVVVYSFQRQFVGTRPHVLKKSLKVVAPFIAYANATASIISEFLVFWIVASLYGISPSDVFFSARISAVVTMLGGFYILLTAATFRMTASQRPCPYKTFSPASTFTEPPRTTIFGIPKFYGCKKTKCLSGYINRLRSGSLKWNKLTTFTCPIALRPIHTSTVAEWLCNRQLK